MFHLVFSILTFQVDTETQAAAADQGTDETAV